MTKENLTTQQTKINLVEIYDAYDDCMKNKKWKTSAVQYRLNWMVNLNSLYKSIYFNKYEPLPSIGFLVFFPRLREVFAADMFDRIVHHFLVCKTNDLFENNFIDTSYNCRVGKGTLYGVRMLSYHIAQASENYTKDCWIGKFDLKGFFMNIDKDVLWKLLEPFLIENYKKDDIETVIDLYKKIVYNDPTKGCVLKTPHKCWEGLKEGKSLFSGEEHKGMAIGNLTSQLLANFYLSFFDKFAIQFTPYYGRYVDDFYVICKTKEDVIRLRGIFEDFLKKYLNVELHPDKVYIQHYRHGIKFIGSVVKTERTYIGNRSRGNFMKIIHKMNHANITPKNIKKFMDSVNSYLGMMKHHKSYKLRRKCVSKIDPKWFDVFTIGKNYEKLILNAEYNERYNFINLLTTDKEKAYKKYFNFSYTNT